MSSRPSSTSAPFTSGGLGSSAGRIRRRIYILSGTNRQTTPMSPNGSLAECRKQTCIRPSFEARTGKPSGTSAVPCLEVTIHCAGPPPAGKNRAILSTGAQSLSLQHSSGYHECARVCVDHENAAHASIHVKPSHSAALARSPLRVAIQPGHTISGRLLWACPHPARDQHATATAPPTEVRNSRCRIFSLIGVEKHGQVISSRRLC